MPAGEVTRESVCPTLPSFLHGDRGRPPTSDGASDAVSGFWTLSAGVGAPPPSPLWPTLRACSHFCRASSKSSMPENTRGRREGHSLTLEGMRRSRRQRPGQDQNWAGPSSPAVTSCRLVSIQAFSRQVCLLTRKGRKGVTGDVGAGQELKK